VHKRLHITFFAIAALGFIDATYLTVEHFLNKIPPCGITGCETVLTSAYSTIASIPVSLLGSLDYLFIIILLMTYYDTRKEIFLRAALLFTVVGFLFSVYFVIIQAFVLGAYCLYCMFSALISTILFGMSVYIFKTHA
jgi:uncharacterized membrane protein